MNYIYLSRFFSRKYLADMLSKKTFGGKQFKEEIENNYNHLMMEYRNEFFFKNTLFNKLVLGKYSLTTTSAFSEMTVGKSKADFVLINHNHGIVYEIKTDLDNLDRLAHQLEDYGNAFVEVYVVTSEKNYYPVYKVLKESNPSVGIIVLTDKVRLSVRKKATKNYSNLNHVVLFKLLRKREYEEILFSKFKRLPEVKPVQHFKTSLQWFKTLDIGEAQVLVMNQLQKRIHIENPELLKGLPMPLRWLVYNGKFKNEELQELYTKLK